MVMMMMIVCVPIVVFCVVTPCYDTGGHQGFGGTYCLHLQGERGYGDEDGYGMFLINVRNYPQG
jgi:hypothetical protein